MGGARSPRFGSFVVMSVGFVLIGLGILGMWLGSQGMLPEPMTRPPGGLIFVGICLDLYALVTLITGRDGFSGERRGR